MKIVRLFQFSAFNSFRTKLFFWVFDKWQGYWFDSRAYTEGDLMHPVKLTST